MSSRTPIAPPTESLRERCAAIAREEATRREGGGKAGQDRQHKMGRLLARERISQLLDKDSRFFEVGLWAAYKMYQQWGNIPAAGAVAGIGNVSGVPCMIVANDATVKAGAFFPATAKKLIRAQRIAFECALPIIYLVDSAGVFLPMQDEIFPDEDDSGRIFRNNSVISAAGIPQFAAIMGNCVAGGAYLPVLCDKILMTEGSGLYLAGPSLVKAAIGRIVGRAVGIVASQRLQVRTKTEGIQMGGVIYSDSADKAARFVMDCNQVGLPILFFQDVTGFMVGKAAEQSGIIRSGAKLVNAVSNSIVPKITIVVGGSFGAGNYALCGKAYDPRFILAWPNARYAVMGAAQASDTVFSILARAKERG